jgi:transcription elongation factor Elf1
MSKAKRTSECPKCGSKYLDLSHQNDNGKVTAICEDCGHEFRTYGQPPKKHQKIKRMNHRI